MVCIVVSFNSTFQKIKQDKKNNQQGLLNPTGQLRAGSIRGKNRLIQQQNHKKGGKHSENFRNDIDNFSNTIFVYGLNELKQARHS